MMIPEIDIARLKEILVSDVFSYAEVGELTMAETSGNTLLYTALVNIEDKQMRCWIKINRLFAEQLQLAREAAKRDFEMLLKAEEIFSGESRLSISDPIAFIEEYAAIVTWHKEGTRLKDWILSYCSKLKKSKAPGFSDDILKVLFNCGMWLGRFQKINYAVADVDLATNTFLTNSGILNDAKILSVTGFDLKALERIRSFLLRYSEPTAQKVGNLVLCHPDFGPRNFLISREGAVTVLDFDELDVRMPLEDLAMFLIRLQMYKRFDWLDDDKISRLEEAFKQGYVEETGADIDEDELKFWMARYMLSTVSSEVELSVSRGLFLRYVILRQTVALFNKWVKENIDG